MTAELYLKAANVFLDGLTTNEFLILQDKGWQGLHETCDANELLLSAALEVGLATEFVTDGDNPTFDILNKIADKIDVVRGKASQ